MPKNSSNKQGQALPEYLPLVAMIAIASLVILGLFGDTLQQQFSHVATELAGKQSTNSQPSQTPTTPTTTPTTPTNTPTTEPTTSPTDPVKCESHWADDKYQSRECNGRWYCGFQKFTDEIKAAANVIYDFFEGVASGIGDQLKGLWELLKDPSVLYDVAKAFIDNPKGTIEAIVKGLGDDVEKVLECGPKDVGKVIGQYASTAMALKVLTKVAKIAKSKKLSKYVDEIECGLASFASGTTIWTEQGQVVIDDIQVGQSVYSRNKNNHKDQYQKVIKTFGRTAPDYYLLTTEFETLKVTEEHPLWLQGKGWTKVSEISVNDVIASLDGDVLILDNKKVETSLQVYNFSVANTPSYFVGESKIWAHNAKLPCKQILGKPASSRILGQNMEVTGITRPANSAAHHIVAGTDSRAAEVRRILQREGIDINEASNGVFLPCNKGAACPPATTHSILHTNTYYKELTKRIRNAGSGTVRDVLQEVANELSNGTFPF